jgi:Skp family chaperone for outer membrane proteins
MKMLRLFSAALLAMLLSAPVAALAADKIKPVVVELFTS